MYFEGKITIGKNTKDEVISLMPNMLNRHGMVMGATGSGKSNTIRVLAESFSSCGIPVLLTDFKGEMSGLCTPGEKNDSINSIEELFLEKQGFKYEAYPAVFWDFFGEIGLPFRVTLNELGPDILSIFLDLNRASSDILRIVYRIAEDEGLLLIDTKDLRATLNYIKEKIEDYNLEYGGLSVVGIDKVIRSIAVMETKGADLFLGEPSVNVRDFIGCDFSGKGEIHILNCQKLYSNQKYSALFLLYIMNELVNCLPETEDMEKPRLSIIVSEAHSFFEIREKYSIQQINQLFYQLQKRGVSLFFESQEPHDIPIEVAGRFGTKILHSIRVYTPNEENEFKKLTKVIGDSNQFSTMNEAKILGLGEVIVSTLDENGIQTMAEKCKIFPPESFVGPLDYKKLDSYIKSDVFYTMKYVESVDRDSAYEFLQRKAISDEEARVQAIIEAEAEKQRLKKEREVQKLAEKQALAEQKAAEKQALAEQIAAEKAALAEQKAAEKAALDARKAEEKAALNRQKTLNNSGSVAYNYSSEQSKNGLGSNNVGAAISRGIIKSLFKLK